MIDNVITPTPGIFLGIIIGFFVLMAFIGFYSNKKTKTLQDFFVMSGKAGVLMSGFAYFATQYSMSTFMGVPGAVYHGGYAGMTVSVPGLSFSMIIPALFVGRRLLLLGKKHGFLTMADYLADRYDSLAIRGLIGGMMLILLVPMMGVQMIGAGVIFKTYTGMPEAYGVIAMGVTVVLYCMAGGIRGVMITDIIQGLLMLTTAITAFVISVRIGGGMTQINETLYQIDPAYLTHPGANNAYPWLAYVSMIVMWSFFTIGQPHLFTKFFTMKNYTVLFKAVILGSVGMWCAASFIEWVGANGVVSVPGLAGKDSDFIVPLILQKGLPPAVASLMVAGIFSAGMSTVSSLLIATSSALSRDLYQKILFKGASDANTFKVSRICTMGLGVLGILFAIWKPGSIFSLVLLVFGGWGVIVASIIFGMYWKRANKYGVFASIIIGEIFYVLLQQPTVKPVLHGLEPVIVSFFVAVVVLVIVSLMTPPPRQEVMDRHFKDLKTPDVAS